jgi:hypothetical protein
MANTPPNNTPPNSKKIALEAAKERREQVINDLESLDVQRRLAIGDKERAKIQREINKLIKEEEGLRQRIALYGEREEKFQKSIADSLADQISSLRTKSKINDKITAAEKFQLNWTEKIQKLLKSGNITHERAEELLKKLNRNASERLAIEEHSIKMAKEKLALEQKIAKVQQVKKEAQLNAAKDYVKGIEDNIRKIPIVGDLMANTLMGEKSKRKLTAAFYKYFRHNKGLMNVMKKAGPLAAGAGIAFTTGFKLATKQSEVMKDIRRTLGLTNDEAREFRDMSKDMLSNSNSMATTQKEILEAASQLSNTYGTTVKNNEKLVNSQITLTKGFGLQGDEAEKINMLADATGQDYEKQLQATVATAQATGKVYKFSFNTNKVLADVAKLSASIQASFKGSTSAMAKAVIQTKLMGTTLGQLDSVADNLLQIESSIENQVTAQLVTGKNINLDKARMLALNNDLVGVGQELVNQGIDYAEFSKMNRVEMQSTAAAMGMQKDELADMLLKQEVYKRAGANIRATDAASMKLNEEKIRLLAEQGDEEAQKYIQSQKQLSMQERMTAAMEKFSAVMETIYYVFIGIGVALAAMTFGIGGITAAGLGILGGITAKHIQGVQDGIAPASNGPFTVTDRKGNIGMTSTGDGLVATPNKPNEINTTTVSNKETNDLLRQLITKVDQPAIIKMGGTTINEMGNKVALTRDYRAGVGNSYNRLGNT